MSLAVRREIVRVCRSLYERGLIAGAEGNVSVRLPGNRILMTPRGRTKGELRTHDLVELSPDGGRRHGTGEASTEAAVHLGIYQARPDAHAVVHAHPPTATGFATAGETLPLDVLPEVTYGLGPVMLIPYTRPGTQRLAERVAEHASGTDVFLLANHGAVTVAPTLMLAHQRMESLEHAARALLVARLLGGAVRLTPDEVADLMADRQHVTGGGHTGVRHRSSGR